MEHGNMRIDRTVEARAALLPDLERALVTATRTGDDGALAAVSDRDAAGWRDGLLSLLAIQDLSLSPIDRLGGTERWEHHPCIAAIRQRLERQLVTHLDH